jgi:sulfur carrier protein ThiS
MDGIPSRGAPGADGAVVVVNQSKIPQALHVIDRRKSRDELELVPVD